MNSAIEGQANLPERWSHTENVEWIAELPGIGWSSPVVWGKRVFLTTVTSDRAYEEPKPGLYAPRGRTEPPAVRHDWLVYCLDLESGDVLWKQSVFDGVPEFPRHQKNSYASETPTTDGERVYVRFGDLGVWAFDMAGELVWEKRIPFKKTMSDWGSASSLVLAEDKLIVLYDNEEESWLAALDSKTGDEVWRSPRDEVSSWATPYIWTNELRTEIVTSGRKKIRSYDLDGNVLWEMDGRMSWAAIATPFSAHGLLYVTSGYFQDSHRPVYAIKPGASGDITPSEDGKSEFVAWYQPRAGNYNTSPARLRRQLLQPARPRLLRGLRRALGRAGLRTQPRRAARRRQLHGEPLGLQRQDLRAERAGRHLRHRGRQRVRRLARQLARRDGDGVSGDRR